MRQSQDFNWTLLSKWIKLKQSILFFLQAKLKLQEPYSVQLVYTFDDPLIQ